MFAPGTFVGAQTFHIPWFGNHFALSLEEAIHRQHPPSIASIMRKNQAAICFIVGAMPSLDDVLASVEGKIILR